MESDWVWVVQAGNGGDRFLKEGDRIILQIKGKELIFFRKKGELYATSSRCPHNKATMVNAPLEGHSLICPLHRYEFDIRNGKNTSGEGYYLDCFPIKLEEGKTWVGFPKKAKLFGLF